MSTPRKRLLILDDDAGVVDFLCESLDARGYETVGRTSPEEALALFERESFDLVITDVEMPRLRGTEVLEALLTRKPGQLVVLITAFGSVELAVAAVKAGACDFVTKPFNIDALVLTLERAFRERQLRREIVRLRAAVPGDTPGGLVARSPAMQKALEVSRRAARSDATVLLTGETGTGKSALARFIHESSSRRTQPFLQLNCAALPSGLAESELFGARRGAYTDAREDRAGVFVSVGGGTLFLDEVGELSLEVQAKLLQALETGRVRPLGSSTETPVRARVLAATNQSLEVLLREGRFRADLYYRLNVIRIEVPPLRERREDILPLVDFFLGRLGEQQQREVLGVSANAMKRLMAHAWPGNVRELANLLERAVALADHDTLVPEDFDLPGSGDSGLTSLLSRASGEDAPLEEVERAYVRRVVEAQGGNKAAAARILGINRRTLYRKLDLDE
ncbi:sigma-54-dependent transcriptional regulator [Myxococcus xanthus]|uniref:Sigma-54-dependent Fis family transcriptional regulator n=1 Tax=Myxococcus xanthus TaxID=34 RepID=A0AAE6G7T3_MYXXA|nr:sigma-54 dependent transcriptional regulator [Myxococcus xanthus]QDE72164.1 sigma-54-dependent Fis family transcriptional regulator [Myxococcus xanthus]QDE79446.1 sigma-54-dependent Fis family transcriptional regulator [Myxococcus xanthus]QDE86811.1 sigma-54-dependent Fis family transcriptional regulator [Myxococcus xanthus]QDF08818.1 sigma-54-dependent Fis family transcriptional regulator [Myxococcus xanthus]